MSRHLVVIQIVLGHGFSAAAFTAAADGDASSSILTGNVNGGRFPGYAGRARCVRSLALYNGLIRSQRDDRTDMRRQKLAPRWLLTCIRMSRSAAEPLKSRGVVRMEEFCLVIGVKFTTRPGDGQFMVRREAYHRILDAFAANGINFSHRHVKVEMLGERPEETLLPTCAGGAAVEPLELPVELSGFGDSR
jgi:hypothetical protein